MSKPKQKPNESDAEYQTRLEEYRAKTRAQAKRWREANPDRVKALKKQWRDANPDKVSAQVKRWYEENNDRAKSNAKLWREKNPDRVKALQKKWYDANPDRVKATHKRYYEEHKEEALARNKQWRNAKAKAFLDDMADKFDFDCPDVYGVVYLVQNTESHKCYIGQTTLSLPQRYPRGWLAEHCYKPSVARDAELFGADSFTEPTVIGVASGQEELNFLEASGIEFYDSYNSGYNLTRGNYREWRFSQK